ncbi:MAG: pentapeptide repeat-containing protein, partial [Phormidesmis sp.]
FLIFFLFFAVIVTLLCFLTSNLSLALMLALTSIKKRYWQIALLVLIIPWSVLVALVLIPTDPSKVEYFNRYANIIKPMSACLISLFITTTSWTIFRFNTTPKREFYFIKNWAIAIASWKSPSFYDQDLSGIDFTGAKIANVDFRAKKLYRTCLQSVQGLDRARVDNQYFDLDNLQVQSLLTKGSSENDQFSRVNLRGAYLQAADMRHFNLIETNLEGADLSNADLRESILLRAVLTDADLSRADLTGACIKDWSINQHTQLTGVACDYIYRNYENGRACDRYPAERDFAPGEFELLFGKVTNAVELIFQDQIDWRALSFTFEKFQIEDDGLGLELKGVEQRGDYWVVKVRHGEGVSKQQVEKQVQSTYEDLRALMEAKDRQINQLLGIVDHQTQAMNQQAQALTHFSQQPFGNSFFITGSTITNLAGSGQIEYQEAASRIRQLTTAINGQTGDQSSPLQRLIAQLSEQNVATTDEAQKDLIQQVLLSEAERDPQFRALLLQQGEQIIQNLPRAGIATAFRSAIDQIKD